MCVQIIPLCAAAIGLAVALNFDVALHRGRGLVAVPLRAPKVVCAYGLVTRTSSAFTAGTPGHSLVAGYHGTRAFEVLPVHGRTLAGKYTSTFAQTGNIGQSTSVVAQTFISFASALCGVDAVLKPSTPATATPASRWQSASWRSHSEC